MSKDSEISLYWEIIKENKRARHKARIASYPSMLKRANIEFTSHNNGGHLIIAGFNSYIDLWPGTDRFVVRKPYFKGIGIRKAIAHARGEL